MKKLIALSFCVLFMMPVAFCQEEAVAATAAPEKVEMKIRPYWFVMLSAGAKYNMDSSAKTVLMRGHMDNMDRLHKEGILKVAGPFGKNDLKWKGIFILDCKSKDEAKKYIMTDPAIAAEVLEAEIVQWYTEPSGSFTPGKPEKD